MSSLRQPDGRCTYLFVWQIHIICLLRLYTITAYLFECRFIQHDCTYCHMQHVCLRCNSCDMYVCIVDIYNMPMYIVESCNMSVCITDSYSHTVFSLKLTVCITYKHNMPFYCELTHIYTCIIFSCISSICVQIHIRCLLYCKLIQPVYVTS